MPETEIFRDRGILITTKRAVVGRRTFALANIISVEIEAFHPYSSWATAILIGAVGLAVYAWVEDLYLLIAGGVVLAGASIWIALLSHYRILFNTSTAEITVLQTSSRSFAEDLIHALNIAIVERV